MWRFVGVIWYSVDGPSEGRRSHAYTIGEEEIDEVINCIRYLGEKRPFATRYRNIKFF